MNEVVPQKRPPHLFQKGKSGNPAGRPKGSKNAISLVKLQIEGELRAQMKSDMQAIVKEIVRQALPKERTNKTTGEIEVIPGDKEMLKLLYSSWVSKSKSADDETPKDKIQIIIGKLDQTPAINGQVFPQSNPEE